MKNTLWAAIGLSALAAISPAFAYETSHHTQTDDMSAYAMARAVVAGPACRLRSKDWASALKVRLEAELRLDRPDLLPDIEHTIEFDSLWTGKQPPNELVSICVGLPDEVEERDTIIRAGDAVLKGASIWVAYLQARHQN